MIIMLFSDLRLIGLPMILNFMSWCFSFLQIYHISVYYFKIWLEFIWWGVILKVGSGDVWGRASGWNRCTLNQPWFLEKCFNRVWSYCCWDLRSITRIVDWFINWRVNWLSWHWSYNRNRRNWWQYVLINNSSWCVYRERSSTINMYLWKRRYHMMNWALINFSNELYLWYDFFRRICNNKITSTENIRSILSNPWLKLLLT